MNLIKRKLKIFKERQFKKKMNNFFDWVKGAKLVELKSCNTKEDPVRPELDVVFRRSYGRKIYGVIYKKEICAIMCFGFTNEVPKTVKELDLMKMIIEITDAKIEDGGSGAFYVYLRNKNKIK
jgi:hypothetical protein